MKEIRITVIQFKGKLAEREIPSFRGAVMAYADNDSLYHNHTEDAGFQFRYPLIQYKLLDGTPSIVGIEDGALSLESLFSLGDSYEWQIGPRMRHFTVRQKYPGYFLADEKAVGDHFRYSLHKWMPFNRENFHAWEQTTGLAGKVELLDAILCGNILTLYKAFGVFFEREILELEQFTVTYKGVKMVAFDAVIETDIALPEHLGIGKGVSHGFGVVGK